MASRYWVGDSGDWSDTAHWATSSGGAPGASVPGGSDAFGGFHCDDDVFFDGNSFSGIGTVNLPGAAFTRDFVTTGLAHAVTFSTSGGGAVVYCSRPSGTQSFTFTSNVLWSFTGTLWIVGAFATTTNIDFGGAAFTGPGTITVGVLSNITTSNQTYQFNSDLSAPGNTLSLATGVASGSLSSNTSTYNLNNHTFSVLNYTVNSSQDAFISSGNNIVNEGTAIKNVGGAITIDGAGSNTINGASATTNLTPIATSSYRIISLGGGTMSPGDLNIFPGGGYSILDDFHGVTFGDLVIAPDSLFAPGAGLTARFATITSNGTPGHKITIDSEAGTGLTSQGTLASDGLVDVSYTDVQNNIASGTSAPFTVNLIGLDLGNNTNWLFPVIYSVSNVFDEIRIEEQVSTRGPNVGGFVGQMMVF